MRKFLVAATALAFALPAWALYKVVGPDGTVTYTDRAPATESSGRVAPFRPGHSDAIDPELPFELRQVVQRYPVTLYSSTDCVPCDSARLLLQQRGIPYTERRILTEADAKALEQLGGGRSLPGLSVGSQQLRGLNSVEWISYLDAAGYPKDSKLPKGWKPGPALPLVDSKPTGGAPASTNPPEPPVQRRAPPAVSAPANNPPGGNTLRF